MAFVIRPLRVDDYGLLAACNQTAMPGTDDTAESLQADDDHAHAVERWVAETDGQVVGHASWFQLPSRLHPQKFWMDGAVHPLFQRRGIGSALLARVLEAVTGKGAISLRTFCREDYADGCRFLAHRGFAEAKRTWVSTLDLVGLDFDRYRDQPAGVEARSIRLCALPELMGVSGWEQRYLDLYNAIQTDVPDIDAAATISMEHFQKNYLGSRTFLADGQFIALDGDRWVGMSGLWKGSDSENLNTGLTGVLPQYRRQGIALALKLRSLAWARTQGITRVHTNNASTNRGMLAINEQLGFVREPAWLHVIRHF